MMAEMNVNQGGKHSLKIVNGEETKPHEYPYVVFVIIDEMDLCGGSLISPRYVLTAAHCIFEKLGAKVILGVHDIYAYEPTKIIITAVDLIPHENYTCYNDIGIIKLSEPVELSDSVNIVALPTRENIDKYYLNSVATVMGWGCYHCNISHMSEMSSLLREMEVTIVPRNECFFQYIKSITEMEICAIAINNRSACFGDSGGPLILDNVLIGIVSVGAKFVTEKPEAYANVGKHLDWIQKITNITIGCK